MVRISIFLINELKLQHAYRVFDGGIICNRIVLTNLYWGLLKTRNISLFE